jgi:hypothetical protein
MVAPLIFKSECAFYNHPTESIILKTGFVLFCTHQAVTLKKGRGQHPDHAIVR